ncbi:cation transporter dimerization domain-containing protein [Paraburkholderia sp. CNPSo 3272]|uniref:cation transporter dimerization domain-containing protein n=1 Tax=Paraburkholderia sp. CNPSo 3272 TaxID=2940931 RepID=UPI00265DA24E|nr:cation transporter dimerization domain-containing protein [Paraburkholderia sp. CNPSo 3272]
MTCRQTLAAMSGVARFHDARTRRMGDMILLEVDAALSLVEAHEISTAVQRELVGKASGTDVMTHIDPFCWRFR